MAAVATAIQAQQGTLVLNLVDVSGHPLVDPEVRFQFRRPTESRLEGDPVVLPVNGSPIVFRLHAFPIRPLVCDITPSRYRYRPTPIFRVRAEAEEAMTLEFAREPGQWKADFVKWSRLGEIVEPLKIVLRDSGEVRRRGTNEVLTGQAKSYDRLPGERWELAKAGMLNIHYRMSTLTDPISRERTWVSFMERLLEVGPDRFIARVHSDLFEVVRTIHRDAEEFRGEYGRASAENHRRNFPVEFRRVAELVSIKSADEFGNLQLTVARVPGESLTLLDADIDENGNLLRHFFDVLRHKVTGGTHPFDIHEILKAENPQADLGYSLV